MFSSVFARLRAAGPPRPLAAAAVVCAAVVAAAAAVGASPAAAAAEPAGASAIGGGSVTLAVGGKGRAAEALAAAGVKVGAVAPAKRRGKRVTLPVRSVAVGTAATVALRGGIGFKAGKRSLKLRSIRVRLTARRATVSARAGDRRLVVFTARSTKRRAKLDEAKVTATLADAELALTPKAARLLRAKLAAGGISSGALGQLGVDAKSDRGSGGRRGGGGSGPGAGAPQAGPIKDEPPILARPAGAIDVTSAALVWRPRESWIQYINGGQGTSVFAGAANGPSETRPGHSESLVYSFLGFPFKSGWYHAATGTAAIYFRGGVGFRWSAHGIDFSAADPEIEINGEASRAIFTFNGTENTRYDDQRGVLVDLQPDPIQKPPGGEIVYSDVPGAVPADTGASVFAGFYPADAAFGTMSVTFTAPTP
jgi:hypothetical protein